MGWGGVYAVFLCGFVPSCRAQCVLPVGEGRLAGSCSGPFPGTSVLLSVLVLVPVVSLAGFCAGVVCVWQLCSGKMLSVFGHAP